MRSIDVYLMENQLLSELLEKCRAEPVHTLVLAFSLTTASPM